MTFDTKIAIVVKGDRDVGGILIPFKQTTQLINPKDDINDFIHQLVIRKFEWDNFNVSEIRPFSNKLLVRN